MIAQNHGAGDPRVGLPLVTSAHLVVAIDGPSGSGKSSTSRGVAARLGLRYLDTGAMFRAMTWWLLRHDVDVHDADAVTARVLDPEILVGTDPQGPAIMVDGIDVALAIRTDEVNAAVSPVSAVPAVRARLLELQRAVIGEGGIVVEGRDIGSVVAPDAQVKIFLTADPVGPRRAAGRRRGWQRRRGHPGVAAQPRPDRLRAGPPRRWCGPTAPSRSTRTAHTLDEVVDQVVALAAGGGGDRMTAIPEAHHELGPAPAAPDDALAPAARARLHPAPVRRPRPPRRPRAGHRAGDPGGQPRRLARRADARASTRPRPVHALTKQEMFVGRMDGFLRRAGQIPRGPLRPRPGRDEDLPARAPGRRRGRHLPRGLARHR